MIGGLVLLFIGAEGLIRGSSSLAIKIGITPLVVGLTVVSFGTSAPELVVSLKAALMGNSSIAMGNVLGSNVANIALILGISAIIRPLNVHADVIRREIPIMIGASVLVFFLSLDGSLGIIEGIIFLLILILYTIISIVLARKEKNPDVKTEFEEGLKSKLDVPLSIILMIGGLGLLILGANLFVQGAVVLAKLIQISDVVIGLTIIAIGTSLPELITSIVASYKNEADIAIGNVVGSNIFNLLCILGITAIILPISTNGISIIDWIVMLFCAVILLPLSKTGFRISRIEGGLLFTGYLIYVYFLLP
jgi:cation:H+ antiporter